MRSILFYHTDKTGGSSIREWFNRHHSWISVNYLHTQCYLALPHHVDLFPDYAFAARPGKVRDECQKCCLTGRSTNSSTVFVEFHAQSRPRFWNIMHRQGAALRQRHVSSGGALVSLIMVRDPLPHMLSHFLMFPPHYHDGPGGAPRLITYAEFVNSSQASGLQTREITLQGGCNTSLALKRLASFDVACNLRWLEACIDTVGDLIDTSRRLKKYPMRIWLRPGVDHRNASHHEWLQAQHEDSVRRAAALVSYDDVRRAAACDQALMDRESEWARPLYLLHQRPASHARE